MMIPEAWQNHETMSPDKRAFYEYHSCLMEPWDGPASIAVHRRPLHRRRARPQRPAPQPLLRDARRPVIMASEVGVLPVDPRTSSQKGRLQPGRMFLVDFEQGRIDARRGTQERYRPSQRPYGDWLQEQRIRSTDLPDRRRRRTASSRTTLLARHAGLRLHAAKPCSSCLLPLVQQKRDPRRLHGQRRRAGLLCRISRECSTTTSSSSSPRSPTRPIDSIREEIVMSLECYIGPEGNLLETTERHCRRLLVPHPILTNEELAAIKQIDKSYRLEDQDDRHHLPRRQTAAAGIDAQRWIASAGRRKRPSTRLQLDRALGSAGQARTRAAQRAAGLRRRASSPGPPGQADADRASSVETGEAREVHHHCLLVGYGADAINPYLAFEALWQANDATACSATLDPDDRDRGTLTARACQGHAQGDGQDGHLDAAVLQGRPDLRGRRAAATK